LLTDADHSVTTQSHAGNPVHNKQGHPDQLLLLLVLLLQGACMAGQPVLLLYSSNAGTITDRADCPQQVCCGMLICFIPS
jgi:hypothetical protein